MSVNRVFVGVDVSNLYYCVKKKYSGRKVDYRKLYLHCTESYGQVYRAVAYASEMQGAAKEFFDCIRCFGYQVKVKPGKEYTYQVPGSEETYKKIKANWDVGMAIDIIRHVHRIDDLVLVTADGDMAELAKFMKEHGVRVHVVACQISKDLREVCDSSLEVGPALLEDERAKADETPKTA